MFSRFCRIQQRRNIERKRVQLLKNEIEPALNTWQKEKVLLDARRLRRLSYFCFVFYGLGIIHMAVEIIMPKLGVDMQEGEIIEWKKQEGDVINEGDVLLEMMSDKTSMELEAEESGVLVKIVRGNGEVVPVTEVIGYIGAEGEDASSLVAEAAPAVSDTPVVATAAPVETVAPVEAPAPAAKSQGGGKVRATPAAREAARDLNIDLGQVPGTGAKGRVHKSDVEDFKGAAPKATPLARKIAEDKGRC